MKRTLAQKRQAAMRRCPGTSKVPHDGQGNITEGFFGTCPDCGRKIALVGIDTYWAGGGAVVGYLARHNRPKEGTDARDVLPR